jgi:hypothetical protein
MATKEDRIEKALDTLALICDMSDEESTRDSTYGRRTAAEEILRHYREKDALNPLRIEVTVNGAVPVRPMMRGEV